MIPAPVVLDWPLLRCSRPAAAGAAFSPWPRWWSPWPPPSASPRRISLPPWGESVGQRSGVLNLGVDGVMLLGAFGAYYTTTRTGQPWYGLLVGLGVGVVMGLVYAFITVTLHAEQGISGIGIYLFGLGFSDLLFRQLVGAPRPIRGFDGLFDFTLPEGRLEIAYPDLYNHSLVIYLAFLLVPAVTLLVNRTTFGLNVRAVGEAPQAADSLGVSVARTRYATIILASTLAGAAGAVLALEKGIFIQNMTNGMGFIAVALVYFGAWRPLGVLAGSLLFSLVTAAVLAVEDAGHPQRGGGTAHRDGPGSGDDHRSGGRDAPHRRAGGAYQAVPAGRRALITAPLRPTCTAATPRCDIGVRLGTARGLWRGASRLVCTRSARVHWRPHHNDEGWTYEEDHNREEVLRTGRAAAGPGAAGGRLRR